MSRFATHARTRFSAPPATARGEVSLRLRRAALRVRSHSGCAAWWARSCRLQPELRANCRAGRARVPARGGYSLRSGGRQGTVYRRGPSARVPARGVSLRPGGWQGIDRRRGGRGRTRASVGRDGCHGGRAAQRARSSVGAQHGALRADIQAAICAESGRKRPGAEWQPPTARAALELFSRARRLWPKIATESVLISRCN
jgi:hypothetical protein